MSLSALFQTILPREAMEENAPLSRYTSMRVGGPTDMMLFPSTENEIAAALERIKQENLPFLVIGNGSNLLFSDAGFRGVILRLGKNFSRIECQNGLLYAQSGALLSAVSKAAAEHSLSGLEFASGIPGTVGGGIYMNAGAYGGEIALVLESAEVLKDGQVQTWPRERFDFSYRHSALMEEGGVALSARFRLAPGDPAEIQALMSDLNARRRQKQPLQYPSCGSFFKRPAGHYAGALIEAAGLKGYAMGDAQVSELHAGFVINRGHATAQQVYSLMRHVQKTVLANSGVMLEPEVRLIGHFEET